jgi:hypothetical protein
MLHVYALAVALFAALFLLGIAAILAADYLITRRDSRRR